MTSSDPFSSSECVYIDNGRMRDNAATCDISIVEEHGFVHAEMVLLIFSIVIEEKGGL